MALETSFILDHNSSFDSNCFPFAYIIRFSIDHKFSIYFKSEELADHVIRRSFFELILAKYDVVALAERGGGPSCNRMA